MTRALTISFLPKLRSIHRHFVEPLEAAQDRAVEMQANAYRFMIVAKDALASREFLRSVGTRNVLRTQSLRIKEAFSDVVQARIMEEGRRPGAKPPPVSAILRWMPYRGMAPNRSVAFAIARAIGRRGMKPRRVAKAAFEQSKGAVIREFEMAVAKAVARFNG